MPPDKNLHKQRNSSGSVIPRSQFCYRTKTQLRLTDDVVQQTKHTQLSKLVDWNARQHNPISQHRPGRLFFPFDPPSDSTFMPYPEAIVSNIARFIAVKRFPHADRIFLFFDITRAAINVSSFVDFPTVRTRYYCLVWIRETSHPPAETTTGLWFEALFDHHQRWLSFSSVFLHAVG